MKTSEVRKPSFASELRFSRRVTAEQIGVDKKGNRHERWSMNWSGLDFYQVAFERVLEGRSIVDLFKDKEEPVVIDLMSPSTMLGELFHELNQQGKRGRGIAVALVDSRNDIEKERDEKLGVIQLEGDLTRSNTWRAVEQSLPEGKKADVIISRPALAYDFLPNHPGFYSYALQKIWNMLSSDSGTLLIQTPRKGALRKLGLSLEDWKLELETAGIETTIGYGILDRYGLVKIVKKHDSPEQLPFMIPKDIPQTNNLHRIISQIKQFLRHSST